MRELDPKLREQIERMVREYEPIRSHGGEILDVNLEYVALRAATLAVQATEERERTLCCSKCGAPVLNPSNAGWADHPPDDPPAPPCSVANLCTRLICTRAQYEHARRAAEKEETR